MTQKTLIVMVGLPGSGKSTWVRNHIKTNPDMNFKVVSSDDIIMEYAEKEGMSYTEAFPKFVGIASKELKIRAHQYVNAGENVIWDQTNMSVKSRKTPLKIFENYYKMAVVVSVDDIELKRRLTSREAAEGKHIPEFVIENMARSYSAPSKDEGFDKIVNV